MKRQANDERSKTKALNIHLVSGLRPHGALLVGQLKCRGGRGKVGYFFVCEDDCDCAETVAPPVILLEKPPPDELGHCLAGGFAHQV
jgi:hypothetical protein